MKKDIRNIDVVARKLKQASLRATNDRLKAVGEERQKKKEIIKRQKAEAMATKQHRVRGEISLSSEKEDESDIRDDTNLDQANDKYSLQL